MDIRESNLYKVAFYIVLIYNNWKKDIFYLLDFVKIMTKV